MNLPKRKPRSSKVKNTGRIATLQGKRMSFLVQAAFCLNNNANDLCNGRLIIKQMKQIANHSQIRLHPEIKRMLCSSCETSLIPYISADISLDVSDKRLVIIQCLSCGNKRKIVAGSRNVWNNWGFSNNDFVKDDEGCDNVNFENIKPDR
ncbi:hypothetical protein GJ496_011923 [Pomphorhynchus laevis]|nr:hypothetical protein GJ496_011923 [Pomphorhynchus laevis]